MHYPFIKGKVLDYGVYLWCEKLRLAYIEGRLNKDAENLREMVMIST